MREERVLRIPGPVAGLFVGAALGVALFFVIQGKGFRRSGPRGLEPGPEPTDPRGAVTILVGSPRAGVDLALLPLREDNADDVGASTLLERDLFPDGPSHRWRRILVTHRGTGGNFHLPLGEGALVLEGEGGESASIDLAGAYERGAGGLSPARRLALRSASVHRPSLEVPEGGSVRALVAFPAGAPDLDAIPGARLADGARLHPVSVTTESLRSALARQDFRNLETASRDQARGRPAVTSPGE